VRALAPGERGGVAATQLCDFTSDRVRAAWSERVASWRARHVDVVGRANADGVDVEAPAARDIHALAGPLLRFFRRREARR
jgi:hypothetical protein